MTSRAKMFFIKRLSMQIFFARFEQFSGICFQFMESNGDRRNLFYQGCYDAVLFLNGRLEAFISAFDADPVLFDFFAWQVLSFSFSESLFSLAVSRLTR